MSSHTNPDSTAPLATKTAPSDGPSTTSNGIPSTADRPVGFQRHGEMRVEPPKKKDLQQSYASIVGDDADPKGWYGGMSTSCSSLAIHDRISH